MSSFVRAHNNGERGSVLLMTPLVAHSGVLARGDVNALARDIQAALIRYLGSCGVQVTTEQLDHLLADSLSEGLLAMVKGLGPLYYMGDLSPEDL